MKYLLISVLVILFGFSGSAQTAAEFEEDFAHLAINGFTKPETDSLLKKHYGVLYFFNPNARLAASIKGNDFRDYPLVTFKSSILYKQHIDMLLSDTPSYLNHLGCMLAAASFDRKRTPQIEALLVRNKYQDFWAVTSLMVLKTKNLGPVIKTLSKLSKQPSASYLIPLFLQLDSNILEKFALDSLDSKDMPTRYFAIRAAATSRMTPMKLKKLQAIITGQDSLKGWAISVLAAAKVTGMSKLVAPYLNSSDLRSVALRALANSPQERDSQLLDSVIRSGPPDRVLLDELKQSSNTAFIRRWLDMLRTESIPEDYYAFIDQSEIEANDAINADIQSTLLARLNDKRLSPLFSYFGSRKDDATTAFLLTALSSAELCETNQLAIVKNLLGRNPVPINNAIHAIMKDATPKDAVLLELLLFYQIYDYRNKVSEWLTDPGLEHYYISVCEHYLKESVN